MKRPNEKTIVRRNFKAFQRRKKLPTLNPFNRFIPRKHEHTEGMFKP